MLVIGRAVGRLCADYAGTPAAGAVLEVLKLELVGLPIIRIRVPMGTYWLM